MPDALRPQPSAELTSSARSAALVAGEFHVVDTGTYQAAAEHVAAFKDLRALIVDYWKEPKRAIGAALASVRAKERDDLEPVDDAIEVLTRKRLSFKALADAEAEADAARRQAEADRKAAAEAEHEHRRLLGKAADAERDGNAQQAHAIRERAAFLRKAAQDGLAPAVRPVSAAVEPQGTHVRKVPATGRCVDLRALCRAIADGEQPETLVKVDQSELNRLARALGKLFSVPGCERVPGGETYASRR